MFLFWDQEKLSLVFSHHYPCYHQIKRSFGPIYPRIYPAPPIIAVFLPNLIAPLRFVFGFLTTLAVGNIICCTCFITTRFVSFRSIRTRSICFQSIIRFTCHIVILLATSSALFTTSSYLCPSLLPTYHLSKTLLLYLLRNVPIPSSIYSIWEK